MVVETAVAGAAVRPDLGAERRRLVPALVPGLVMLVLGVVGATGPGLGWDETATVDVARRSVSHILATAHTIDAVFAPYYLFMHAWTGVVGVSELAFRAPSILAMAAAVALTGELGRRLFDPVVGTVAGLFLCVVPATTRYAQEARPYAIGCMLAVLATLLLYGCLAEPRPGQWAAYGAAVVLLGASHLVALTIVGGHAVAVLRHRGPFGSSGPSEGPGGGRRRRGLFRLFGSSEGPGGGRRRRGLIRLFGRSEGPGGGRQHSPVRAWLAAVGVALAGLAPLAYLGAGQRDAQLYWVDPLTAHAVAAAPAEVVGSAGTGWLLVGLALLAGRRRAELAALALAPVLAVAAVSVIAVPMWVPRYLLIALPPLALAASAGAVGTARRAGVLDRAGIARLAVALLVLGATAYPEQRKVRGVAAHNGGNYKQSALLIARLDQPGDAIVFQDGRSVRAGIGYYLREEPDRPADVLLDRPAAAVNRLAAIERADVAARLRDARRVWLVVMDRPKDPTKAKPAARPVLHDHFVRTGVWRFTRATVALYHHR